MRRNEYGPASAPQWRRRPEDRLVLVGFALSGPLLLLVGAALESSGVFGADAAGLLGVVAVVADHVRALVGDVPGEFSEEIQGLEYLEVNYPRFLYQSLSENRVVLVRVLTRGEGRSPDPGGGCTRRRPDHPGSRVVECRGKGRRCLPVQR